MKLYKYRAIDPRDVDALSRVGRIIRDRLVWCARPDTLNDPEEFGWTCDFTPSSGTLGIVADLLQKTKGHPRREALRRAQAIVNSKSFESIGRPVIEQMIEQVRDEIGVACFGSAPDNSVLWDRYAAEGTGIAVELEVPDSSLGDRFHRVIYDDNRRIHIDEFIRSMEEYEAAAGVYATLLTKTRNWQPEEEIRFISKRQRIEVALDGATVTRVLLGPRSSPVLEMKIAELAGGVPIARIATDGLTLHAADSGACKNERRCG